MNSIPDVQRRDDWQIQITDTYTHDYDIIFTHGRILGSLKNEKIYQVAELKMRFNVLFKKLDQKLEFIKLKRIISDLKSIVREVKEILSGKRIQSYTEEVYPWLIAYNSVKDNEISEDDGRIHIIESFFDVARNYCEVDVIRIKEDVENTCPNCDEILTQDFEEESCPNCGTEIETLPFIPPPQLQRQESQSSDDSIENYKKVLDYYQCKNIHIKNLDQLIEELDEFFTSINKNLSRENILKNPLDEYGIRVGTSHEMILNALENIKRTIYNKYVYYIGHVYWGWTVRDVSDQEELILEIYTLTQNVYNKIPIEQRKRSSALGTSFRNFKILEMIGHKCRAREFKMAENDNSYELHMELWKIMCEGCNDPRIVFIDSNKPPEGHVTPDFFPVVAQTPEEMKRIMIEEFEAAERDW